MVVSVVWLIVETLLDLCAVALGVVIIWRAHDNRMQLAWGLLCILLCGVFLADNIRWLAMYYTSSVGMVHQNDLLLIPRMIKWVGLAFATSLFPLSSLRPGYLTSMRLLVLSIPLGVVILVALCYQWFNGFVTPLHTLQDVIVHFHLLDVQLRVAIFAATVILPPVYFLSSLKGKGEIVRRRATPVMKLFICSMFLILAYYIAFMLFANNFIFHTYGIVVALFNIAFSFLFLLNENPLSVRELPQVAPIAWSVSPVDALYQRMNVYLETDHPYANPDYSIADLAGALGVKSYLLAETIRLAGFSGFREYINYLRILQFKTLAHTRCGQSVKELMYQSGFTSRSTFYRIFSSHENMTPLEYLEQLVRTK